MQLFYFFIVLITDKIDFSQNVLVSQSKVVANDAQVRMTELRDITVKEGSRLKWTPPPEVLIIYL